MSHGAQPMDVEAAARGTVRRVGTVSVVSNEPERNPWLLRASDADREQYVALLQSAFLEGRLSRDEYDERMGMAYRATTYADLAPLLADLPIPPDDIPGPPMALALPAASSGRPVARGAPSADHWRVMPRGVKVDPSPLVATFGEVVRDGRWAVPRSFSAVAVFGSVRLDLTHAMLEAPTIEIKAVAVFGALEITIPGDMNVEVTGSGLFGGFEETDERSGAKKGTPPPPGAPVVRVSGVAVFGGVTVTVAGGGSALGPGFGRALPPPPERKLISPPDSKPAEGDDTR